MTSLEIDSFLDSVQSELDHARTKHPTPIRTRHEAYAVILEEVCEFWDEVKAQKPNVDAMYRELVQIAAMCARAADDLELSRE